MNIVIRFDTVFHYTRQLTVRRSDDTWRRVISNTAMLVALIDSCGNLVNYGYEWVIDNFTFSDTVSTEKATNKSTLTSRIAVGNYVLIWRVHARQRSGIITSNQPPRETVPEGWKEIDSDLVKALFYNYSISSTDRCVWKCDLKAIIS